MTALNNIGRELCRIALLHMVAFRFTTVGELDGLVRGEHIRGALLSDGALWTRNHKGRWVPTDNMRLQGYARMTWQRVLWSYSVFGHPWAGLR